MELKDNHLKQIMNIIKKSSTIKEIDISCNHFTVSKMINFIDFLKY